jgi:hypothetical protein
MMIVKELSEQRHASRVFSEVFYLKFLFENLNLFLNLFLNSSSLKLVITVRTEFSDPRNEFPITRKLKTRFCNLAGDKEWGMGWRPPLLKILLSILYRGYRHFTVVCSNVRTEHNVEFYPVVSFCTAFVHVFRVFDHSRTEDSG